jgi:hypothetical protein
MLLPISKGLELCIFFFFFLSFSFYFFLQNQMGKQGVECREDFRDAEGQLSG